MNKKLIKSMLGGILILPMVFSVARTQSVKADVTNETAVEGDSYYGAGALCNLSEGWPTQVIPFSTQKMIQFLFVSTVFGGWGDYAVTTVTTKIDVSQELGKNKVYTLEGSESGFRLFDEKGNKIAEKYGDGQGSRKGSDDPTQQTLYWNRTSQNLEVRIPYVTFVGTDWNFEEKGSPVLGIACQAWYANGHTNDASNYTDYSQTFNDFDDPKTFTRIQFDETLQLSTTNYLKRWQAPYNYYSESSVVTIGGTQTTLTYNQAYTLTHSEAPEGKIFKGFNTKADGTGDYFPETGTYTGNLPSECELFEIFSSAAINVKFLSEDGETVLETQYENGDSLVLPTEEPSKEGFGFAGWY